MLIEVVTISKPSNYATEYNKIINFWREECQQFIKIDEIKEKL